MEVLDALDAVDWDEELLDPVTALPEEARLVPPLPPSAEDEAALALALQGLGHEEEEHGTESADLGEGSDGRFEALVDGGVGGGGLSDQELIGLLDATPSSSVLPGSGPFSSGAIDLSAVEASASTASASTSSSPPATSSSSSPSSPLGANTKKEPNATGNKREAPADRKARMAAACRRFREKRKREMESLRTRNEELEIERESYRRRIAELQTEAQMLRFQGAVDMAKENELLRAQIRKHKRFLQTIVTAARSVPSITDEDKTMVLREGVDAALGQILGVVYASANDSSWKIAVPKEVAGLAAQIKYQHLPLGTSVQDAKRINMRIDIPELPGELEDVFTHLWNIWTADAWVNKTFAKYLDAFSDSNIKIEQKQVFPQLDSEELRDGSIKVFHYSERHKDSHDIDFLMAVHHKEITVYPSAYQGLGLGDQTTSEPTSAKVIGCCSSQTLHEHVAEVKPVEPGVTRIQHPVLEGGVVRQNPDGASLWLTLVLSFPIEQKGFSWFSSVDGLVDETGNINEQMFAMMTMFLNDFPGRPGHGELLQALSGKHFFEDVDGVSTETPSS